MAIKPSKRRKWRKTTLAIIMMMALYFVRGFAQEVGQQAAVSIVGNHGAATCEVAADFKYEEDS